MKILEINPNLPFVETPSPQYMAWYPEGGFYVNLTGDYNYLETPYYDSQDMEFLGKEVHPTCKEMLDAYITPIFLEKVKLHGIRIPEFYITNGHFEPPVIIDPVNPFLVKGRIVLKAGREKSTAKSLTRNFTYSMCCQELPPESRIVYIRSILGKCHLPKYREIVRQLWECLHIPLALIRVILQKDGTVCASDISPLPIGTLRKKERQILERCIQWQE